MPGIGDWIKKAASGLSGGTFSGIADVISKFVPDPTAKAEALKELELARIKHEEEMAKIALQAEETVSKERINEDNQISERWKADAESDSSLSKNTRPLVMLSLLGFLFIIIILDSLNITFDVKAAYVSLMETLLVTVVIAYFGSRGVEKYKSMHEATKQKTLIK